MQFNPAIIQYYGANLTSLTPTINIICNFTDGLSLEQKDEDDDKGM